MDPAGFRAHPLATGLALRKCRTCESDYDDENNEADDDDDAEHAEDDCDGVDDDDDDDDADFATPTGHNKNARTKLSSQSYSTAPMHAQP